MKKLVFSSLLAVIILSACTKEGQYTESINDETKYENSVFLQSGTFEPTTGITVSGHVQLRKISEGLFVQLDQFNISKGPDLKVYLSKSNRPDDFINLGALQADKNIYTIPVGISILEYTHVLIHCQQYNHLFAIAQLQ